jgi:hypothetical protein
MSDLHFISAKYELAKFVRSLKNSNRLPLRYRPSTFFHSNLFLIFTPEWVIGIYN